MPDAEDNAKLTGDTHPPEVEEATPGLPDDAPRGADADGTERARGMARDLADEGRPGKGENQAGFLKDKDAAGRS